MTRHRLLSPALSLLFAGALLACAAPATGQQAYPSKSIRFLVGAPPGGSNDLFARAIGQQLQPAMGQQVLVDNRPGANQMIAADIMAKSPADGHTIYITSTSFTTGAALQPKLPFDPVNDVTGITMLGQGPLVYVIHPALPAKTMKELISLARARPDQLNYTSSGIGGINHLGTEVLLSMAKINMVHVPHKGMAPALTDLISGQVQVLLVSLPSVTAQMQSGRLRALAVSTAKRTAFMPQLPTVAEAGVPGYESSSWQALLGPARMPAEIVNRLYREIAQSAKNPEMVKRFNAEGMVPLGSTPRELDEHIARELEKWVKVTKAAGLNVH